MPFEPGKITKDHVLEAVRVIEERGLEMTPSTRWEVIINGNAYPPKEIMRYAHEQMNGERIWNYSGGTPTNKYLESMNFDIAEKNMSINKSGYTWVPVHKALAGKIRDYRNDTAGVTQW